MSVTKGTTLGPYEILAHIGAGGMGDIWRARDKRIGRDVAIKVLPEAYAPGDERVRRFEQEARAAGALNHPGLVTIFDVGTVDGAPYIVMELLEGQTLRDAIGEVAPKPLPTRKMIDYAIQLASALAVAHEKGILHRDLKPENIIITPDGRVKILDFGLAKLAEEAKDRDQTGKHLTSTGMVVGTPGYMSPEQVRAKPLDYRTDIFSLGAVMYEMLSGRRAFDHDSAVETMNAVLSDEPPPLSSIAPDVPPALEAMVRHCMEKNPRERFQSARDLAFQLHLLPEFQHSRTDAFEPIAAPKRRLPYRAAIVALSLLALTGGGFALFHGTPGTPPHERRTYKQLTSGDAAAAFPTLSPDGKTFAFVSDASGNLDIYQQRVDGRVPTNLTADSPADDSEPAFSPDGSKIAFRSERDGGGIFVMGATGESVRRVTDFGHNPSWSPDGNRIVISTAALELRPQAHRVDGELWIVDTRSGQKHLLYKLDHPSPALGDALQPSWSPHGKRIAFWGVTESAQRDLWTIDPDAPQPAQTIVRATTDSAVEWNPVWAPDGKSLYFGSDRDGTMNLWRVAIDEATGATSGDAEPLTLPTSFSCNFSFSQQGDMVYTTIARSYRLLAFPLNAVAGKIDAPRPLFGGSEEIFSFEPSPDGRSIAFTTSGSQEDLFVGNADGTRLRQLTNDAARDRGVTWSRDGKTLYFYSNRDGSYQLWSIHEDGSSLAAVTDPADLRRSGAPGIYYPNASPDGRTLAAQTPSSAVLVHLDRPMGQRVETIGDKIIRLQWSPDGKRIAGVAERPDAKSIVVYSLQTRRWETVAERGTTPMWLPDSRHLAFFDKQNIGVVDLDSKVVTTTPFKPPSNVEPENSQTTHVSSDGRTLFLRQTLERDDVWLVRFGASRDSPADR